jgi:hypothetical protein
MGPKYKVGDFLQHYYEDGTVGTLRVDFIKYNTRCEQYSYCEGDKHCCRVLLESDVIGVEPRDEEEYQLYLKLKEKYE